MAPTTHRRLKAKWVAMAMKAYLANCQDLGMSWATHDKKSESSIVCVSSEDVGYLKLQESISVESLRAQMIKKPPGTTAPRYDTATYTACIVFKGPQLHQEETEQILLKMKQLVILYSSWIVFVDLQNWVKQQKRQPSTYVPTRSLESITAVLHDFRHWVLKQLWLLLVSLPLPWSVYRLLHPIEEERMIGLDVVGSLSLLHRQAKEGPLVFAWKSRNHRNIQKHQVHHAWPEQDRLLGWNKADTFLFDFERIVVCWKCGSERYGEPIFGLTSCQTCWKHKL